jgi:hypothetical protein
MILLKLPCLDHVDQRICNATFLKLPCLDHVDQRICNATFNALYEKKPFIELGKTMAPKGDNHNQCAKKSLKAVLNGVLSLLTINVNDELPPV